MEDGEVEFDVEKIMAEITVAAPEFVPFLVWCAEKADENELDDDEFKSVSELVYSYSRAKNEDEEDRMMNG